MRSPSKAGAVNNASVRSHATWDVNDTMRSDWNFDTVKSMAAMGTFRGSVKDLNMPAGMILEDGEESDGASMDSGLATKGSDPIHQHLGNPPETAESNTVVIKSLPSDDEDVPSGMSTRVFNLISNVIEALLKALLLRILALCVAPVVRPTRRGHQEMDMAQSSTLQTSERAWTRSDLSKRLTLQALYASQRNTWEA
jgi:hypothetical protein